ncbi:MAG: energy-coupling factor transporter transmembrane component T family protein [Bacillota bacterium]|jgi:energy-coupling factor transport system permease protein
MIGNFTIGQYYPAKSLMHRLDPRVKITCVFLYFLVLFLSVDYFTYALLLMFSAIVIKISRVPLRTIVKALKPILIFVVMTAFLHFFFTPGTELFRWKIVKVTREGLDKGVFMSLRLILLIGVSSLLTFTTTPISLTDGMESMLGPLKKIKVPAHELAMMMTIALRFIPTLLEETDRIMKAQMSRGVDFRKGGITKKVRAIVPLLVPLFISAFRRAEDLALAMEARGYHGGEGRTRMRSLQKITFENYFVILIMLIFLFFMVYYRWF